MRDPDTQHNQQRGERGSQNSESPDKGGLVSGSLPALPKAHVDMEQQPASASTNIKTRIESGSQVNEGAQRVTAGLVLSTALKSSPCWSGIGASVVCIGSSYVGIVGHGLATLLTLRNEVLLASRGNAATRESSVENLLTRSGYIGLIRDTINSPGFSSVAAGTTYLTAGIEAAVRGHFVEAGVFSFYCLGLMAVAAAINQGYSGTRTDRTLPERAFSAGWALLPARLQNLLKDPGPYLSIGNTSLVIGTLNLKNLLGHPIETAVLGVGVALGATGLIPTCKTFFSGTYSATSSRNAILYNAYANAAFSVASFLQGSQIVGVAKLCWTVSCGLLARVVGEKK